MKAQQEKQKLAVNFNHRLSILGDYEATAYAVSNAVDDMAERATSVLILLQGEFVKEEPDGSRLNDNIIYYCIETAIKEIADMRAVVDAHLDAVRSHV